MIRLCGKQDEDTMYRIINDAAKAYQGVIPADRYHEPYMSREELGQEIENGVVFWGIEEDGELVGVMGIQDKGEVALIRHAYVRTARRQGGIGSSLLRHITSLTEKPILIGTWEAASWAISFYVKNGFALVTANEKQMLLQKYWDVPERQIETSVVLASADFLI
ncbi:GNAT family N-acetyltransferase [Paenibacillus tianjinensis]|uniref:GNAT family N-acetyltransferase n=1 Tax=Paenibacillus tianjinensis TaxID=2810347 RepID=A0ABX7LDU5_9BACL|nr:GNAT family N-acetyltransferase [Paenibacillus tianjinensis]QSF44999.1 GNAT family N-acetyltransferase [Paenibacillus tianjinensis]